MSSAEPFGAILAGGENSRYGAPKALAPVGGVPIVERVAAALRQVTPDLVVSANEPGLFTSLGVPIHPDERPGLGPLGGIHTALLRAQEAGRLGILAVACDMPFPSVALLKRMAALAFPVADGGETPDLALPSSPGPRGVEPLFAAYRTSCLPAMGAALERGDRRMIGFHHAVSVHTLSRQEVEALCDPAVAFLNVNTPEDRERAERLAGGV